MKDTVKDFIQRFFLALGIVLMLGIFISRDFRNNLAESISPFLDPVYQAVPVHVVIFLLAIITGTYTTLIQRYSIDFSRFKRIQKEIMAYQKEYMDAVKKDNQAKLKQLEPKKQEVQKMQGEMMGMQFKPMLYSGIVTIPIFMWLWTKTKSEQFIAVPFSVDPIHIADPFIPFLPIPWWIVWYLLCSVVVSQVVKKVFRLG